MNRVPQCVHVATPNRSTIPGGAPQFGQLIAIGGRRPAGTIGCWIGGGGGSGARRNTPVAAAIASTIKTMKTPQNGSKTPRKPALPNAEASTPRATSPKNSRNATMMMIDFWSWALVRRGPRGEDGEEGACTTGDAERP